MTEWRKSSHSGGVNDNACVEVARVGEVVRVRDSKDPSGARLGFAPQGFGGLVGRIRRGEFDR
ncbi:DUF397 domain-containing protein [Actinomadura fibrosa]|uniref:DUF397 domain-containing protein n=1 Tax=Actinomadura fibrosa TaxID=111802 RepID=A0ABW2XTP4_9ACTN|nr:DUF397 domain-containing protein [Actinomadura fibrosa]